MSNNDKKDETLFGEEKNLKKFDFRKRLYILFSVFAAIMFVIMFFLAKIMLSDTRKKALNFGIKRPVILDRQGVVLARSILIRSVYANPSKIENKQEAIDILMRIFPELDKNELKEKLYSDKNFTWIIKNISKEQEKELLKAKIDFIEVRMDYGRVYPHNHLFSHVVGYVNADQKGVMGIERWLDANYDDCDSDIEISSTLDIGMQYVLFDEISHGVKEFGAEWGGGIIADIETGEILALVSYPDFDPHKVASTTDKCMFNHMVSGVYEFGSIMKIFNLALCFQYGDPYKEYDVSSNLIISSFTIRDNKPYDGSINIIEGFYLSSDICHAKAALDIGGERQKEFLMSLGFFDPIEIELIEIGKPTMPEKWSKCTTITASYGYGISFTPLNVIDSFIRLINPHHRKLKLLKNIHSVDDGSDKKKNENIKLNRKKFVYPKKLIKMLLDCLNAYSEKWHDKKVSEHKFSGKTGTANMIKGGKYIKKRNRTSLLCVFPSDKPKYVMIVMFSAPKPSERTYGFATSFWFTVPVARNIVNIIMNFSVNKLNHNIGMS